MKKCKSCQSEIDDKATKCPHCKSDQRIWFAKHKVITGLLLLIFLIVFISSGNSNQNKNSQITQIGTNNKPKVNTTELMAKNEPNIKKLNFTTSDYVGKTFTYYVMAGISDYYNYGFRDEMKYYSIRLWDDSVASEYSGVYAYIDKNKPENKSKELIDILLKNNVFLKIEANIPVEKYQEGSNAFLELNNWELVQ